jgi:hypothetical protein
LPSKQLKTSLAAWPKIRQEVAEKIIARYPSEVEFVKNFNHRATVQRYENLKTVAQAYDTGYVTLAELKVIYSAEAPRFLIESWLMQFILYLDLPLNKDQIKELAWYMYEELYMLNMAELNLFFNFIKKGRYGSFYGRIDPAELLRWCREYRRERGAYISKLPDDYQSPVLKRAKEEFNNQKSIQNENEES